MANIAGPYGFRPVQSEDNSGFTGKTTTALIQKTNTDKFLVGDLVKKNKVQIKHLNDGKPYPVILLASPGDADLMGVIVGIKSQELVQNQFAGYRPAGVQLNDVIVSVTNDRDQLYVVQEDSDGGAIDKDSVGQNIDFVLGGGNIPGRTSTSALNSSTVGSANTLPLRLVAYDGAIDNEEGAFASWIVKINLDLASNTTGLT